MPERALIDTRRMVQARIDALFANAISAETFIAHHQLTPTCDEVRRAEGTESPQTDTGLAAARLAG